jgi:diaminopimelate decarboxylase
MFKTDIVKRFEALSTPFYYYDLGLLRRTLENLVSAARNYNFIVHYAMKANTNDVILSTIKNYGLGADCVSGNEIKKAIEIGFSNEHIVFAGVGKTDTEINHALDVNIFCFNCESSQEIEVVNELAGRKGKVARIALRINPNVNANTHHYITTGLEENKFGINLWELEAVIKSIKSSRNLNLIGIHFHIGSQITDLNSFKNLCTRINEIQKWFESHHIYLEHINAGGGLGVNYHEPEKNAIPDFEIFFKIFHDFLERRPNQKIHFELGRSVVAQCCSLISRVLYIKNGLHTNFIILDAGMTELIRPALYQSYHKIENISSRLLQFPFGNSDVSYKYTKYDVVGPICESSDCFGKSVELPETSRGDLFALHSAGAYGEVMASNYNLREKALSVYSDF